MKGTGDDLSNPIPCLVLRKDNDEMETMEIMLKSILRMFYSSTDHVRDLFDLNVNFTLQI